MREQIFLLKMRWLRCFIGLKTEAMMRTSWQELLIMRVTPRTASVTELLRCAEKQIGILPQSCATTSLLMLADTLLQTPFVACVTQLSEKEAAGMTFYCQIMRSWNVSIVATKSCARQMTIASLIATRLTLLFATILIFTKDAERQRNGGVALSASITF